MPTPFSHLRAGDISKTSPVDSPAGELSKRMVLAAVELQIPAAEALGSTVGFLTWVFSHFSDVDRALAYNAFISSLDMSVKGETAIVKPLSEVAYMVDPEQARKMKF